MTLYQHFSLAALPNILLSGDSLAPASLVPAPVLAR